MYQEHNVKGIILAGGNATRLYPSTISVSKHLLNVYDKPMIYYPLSILMLAGIQDILIITTEFSLPIYQKLLQDGNQLGISIQYATQLHPRGLADAFLVGETFIGDSNVCLILGDNIFYGHGLPEKLKQALLFKNGAKIFGYYVKDPGRYGVVQLDPTDNNKVLSIEEKPLKPKSNYAVTGLYFFDNSVVSKARQVVPSARKELEIISVIQQYIDSGQLDVELMGRGIAWLDTGTHDSLLEASNFIAAIEKRQGLKVACLEEVAYHCGYIDKKQLTKLADMMINSTYYDYLRHLIR